MKRPVFHVHTVTDGELSPPFRLDTIDEARLVAWKRAWRLRLPTIEIAPGQIFAPTRDAIYIVHLSADGERVSASTFNQWPQEPP
jgi:hypothetical protein